LRIRLCGNNKLIRDRRWQPATRNSDLRQFVPHELLVAFASTSKASRIKTRNALLDPGTRYLVYTEPLPGQNLFWRRGQSVFCHLLFRLIFNLLKSQESDRPVINPGTTEALVSRRNQLTFRYKPQPDPSIDHWLDSV